jgi:replicative DNA helicase Mcm (EC 3.6.1.-)
MQEFSWPDDDMGEIIELPSTCPVCGKAGQFRLIEDKSTFIDYQKAVVQERPEEIPPGQLPRQLEVVFEDDLVDVARPGDRVKIVGILEIKKDSQIKRGSKSVFDFYLKVNSIEISQKVLDEVKISEEDEKKIKELAKDPWIREKIISSIAPSIYGHWEIKESIALALFGGVSKLLNDGTRIRGDIHVLIIGDPGTAKSQILQFASRVAPRAVYTTGKGSTAAGLTATVTRDKNSGDFYLEAGALVLADGGVAVIDEIDK